MNGLMTLCALCAFSLGASAHEFAESDVVQMPEMEPNAPVEGKLGTELALVGNTVLVSAPQAFDYDGAVFAFELTPDGRLQFQQQLAADGSTYKFGMQLAADGDHAVVAQSGSKLRMYRRSGAVWQQTQSLVLADVPLTPGTVVRSLTGDLSMSGDLLAIGNTDARIEPNVGDDILGAGAVVLYRRDGSGQWRFENVVTAPTPVANAYFGAAVAVSGNTLLVGADGEGKAYVFERTGAQWQLARSLASPGGGFGWSAALDGDLAVVGRPAGFVVEGISNTGSFRAYERNLGGSGQWGLRNEYVSSRTAYIDNFSASLALHGNVLLVGAPGENLAVFFVRGMNGEWVENAVLDLATTAHSFFNADFGESVAFNGLRAVIGAPKFPDVDVVGTSGAERWGSLHAWTSLTGGGAISGECGGSHPFDVIYCDGYDGDSP